jgi:hypothetical protein
MLARMAKDVSARVHLQRFQRDGVFIQTVYVSAVFDHTRIVYDAPFKDVITALPDGRTQVDLRLLSQVEPASKL